MMAPRRVDQELRKPVGVKRHIPTNGKVHNVLLRWIVEPMAEQFLDMVQPAVLRNLNIAHWTQEYTDTFPSTIQMKPKPNDLKGPLSHG